MRDPAPSRIAYRIHRLMLTPGVKLFLRAGVPFLVALLAGLIWFSDPARQEAVVDRVAEVRRQIEERPEFMVNLMAIETATDSVADEIRAALHVDLPSSSFDLDLEVLKGEVERLDAVAAADVHIRAGGILQIVVDERIPAVIWRSEKGLVLLDREGHKVAPILARRERADLPLIVGPGAEAQIEEALALVAASHPIEPRLRGLVRVGERRWDIALDRDQRILLPEDDAVVALQKVIQLDRAQDLLARDIAAVDFRNPRRPVLRLTTDAATRLHETGGQ